MENISSKQGKTGKKLLKNVMLNFWIRQLYHLPIQNSIRRQGPKNYSGIVKRGALSATNWSKFQDWHLGLTFLWWRMMWQNKCELPLAKHIDTLCFLFIWQHFYRRSTQTFGIELFQPQILPKVMKSRHWCISVLKSVKLFERNKDIFTILS